MTRYASWISYSGTAEIVLVAVLAVAAAAVAYAGARLPLPARLPMPGRKAKIVMLAAWVLAIAALLVSTAAYIVQVSKAGLAHAPRTNPITPVTLTGMVAVFCVIALSQRARGRRVALGSAVVGTMAAPVIFELPFDLVIMGRTHPLVDPTLYLVLLYGTLIAVNITTLALVSLSPAARVRRATLWCFAGMLALFAVWGLFGFSYPSAPGPIVLNMLSKILALITAVTLFLPQRRAPGQPAQTSAMVDVRPRRRVPAGAMFALVLALAAAGCSPAGRPSAAPAAGPVWLCRPGQAADPCAASPAATAVTAITASGALKPAGWPSSAAAAKFDCFYLTGTTSLADVPNAPLVVTKLDMYIAAEQGAPFSQVCDVWSPVYRGQTLPTVQKGLAGNEALMRSTAKVAFDSALVAWQFFLAHSDGKPIVLIGDSQGSAILIHLISARLDHEPSVLRRLVVAILVGGNLQVPAGGRAGTTFTKVPLCTAATQTGCAIAFSSYPAQPPADSVFGRPGQGVSLQSGQTAKAGQQVACVNPADLAGGTADLDPYLLTASQDARYEIDSGRLTEHVATPWVTYPGLYSATCEHRGGASWLQVTSLAGTSRTRPVVNDGKVAGVVDTGPAWGYHGFEYNLALGSLLRDVAEQETAWETSH
jgi:hypothetical protein